MQKTELIDGVENLKAKTHDALQLVYNSLNKGQRSKLLKDNKIKELFDRYNVDYESEV